MLFFFGSKKRLLSKYDPKKCVLYFFTQELITRFYKNDNTGLLLLLKKGRTLNNSSLAQNR